MGFLCGAPFRAVEQQETHSLSGAAGALLLSIHSSERDRLDRYAAPFSDTLVPHRESHAVIDFAVGKDVGLGMLGPNGGSRFSAGIRLTEFSTKSTTSIYARPDVSFINAQATFYQYALNGQTEHNFHGVGPSLSWNASAALLGNADNGELTLDWGVNGAVLFGRQKADVQHTKVLIASSDTGREDKAEMCRCIRMHTVRHAPVL